MRIDNRVKLVGNAGIVRASGSRGTRSSHSSSSRSVVAATGKVLTRRKARGHVTGVGAVGGSTSTDARERLVSGTAIKVRIDTRIKLVGNLGVVGANVNAVRGSSSASQRLRARAMGTVSGTKSRGIASPREERIVITARVDARIHLFGEVRVVGTGVGAGATTGGGSSGASVRTRASDTRLDTVSASGGHSVSGRVDTGIQLVDDVGLVGTSGVGHASGATSIVLSSAKVLVIDIGMSSTVN